MNARIRQSRSEGRTALKVRNWLAAFLVATVLGACTGATEPAATVRIVPASPTVTLQTTPYGPTLNTSVTLTNTSKYPVVYSFCGLALERKAEVFALAATTGKEWIQVWAPICAASLNIPQPPPLAPGESLTIPITVAVPSSSASVFDGLPALYRVHLFLFAHVADDYRAIPPELSSSDPFTVVAQ